MLRRLRCGWSVSALSAGVLLTLPAGALAASVNIGSTFVGGSAFNPPATYVVVSTATGSPSYVVPNDGSRITSFSMQGGPGQVKLKVMRKTTTVGKWKVIGQSSAVTLVSAVNRFSTSVAVHPGDVLGLTDVSTSGTAPIFAPGFAAGDVLAVAPGDAAVGSLYSGSNSGGGFRLNVSATVQLRPVVTLLSAKSGPAAGGTPVTITGRNFTGTTAVKFGTTPAKSFKVVSNTRIDAVAPAGTAGTTVDVGVSSAGGTSTPVVADRYTFT